MNNLVSCVSWVKRGAAAQHPTKYALDDNELQRVSALARIELEDARKELERAQKAAGLMDKRAEADEADDDDEWVDEDGDEDAMDEDGIPMVDEEELKAKPKSKDPDDLAEYNLDDYDEDDDAMTSMGPFSNIKGLTYHRNNDEDPYITLKDDEQEDEREELEVLPADNLVVAAKTEDEISQLEIYVYDESQENLYIHHDLMLPSFPLCLEWLDFPPITSPSAQATATSPAKQFGNYIAVGTLEPEIEIWSLDVVEAMYPDMVLGRPDKTAAHVPTPLGTGKKKRKKMRQREKSSAYHVDAVLSLSWNRTHRNLLASASADCTVKLWDLNRNPTILSDGDENEGALRSFNVHKDKVQAVQWNAQEPTVLLTGSYDHTVRTFDSRAPDAGVVAMVGADVEAIRWDPWEAHGFYVSLENGIVLNFDARTLPSTFGTASPARFTLSAHNGAASALDVNPHIRGCIATGGTDKAVKVWNVNADPDEKRQVSLVISRDLGVGKVFSAAWSPDDPLTLAAGGSEAKLQVWDIGANAGARTALKSKLAEAGKMLKEKSGDGVIGALSDDEDDSNDDD
ncbi:transducin protein/WD-40 repeat protein [Wolfiporia cocos MD-104 SS10]|uniref:Transducin protein/WD-40 repeat protein n=1 Tax=Wolfiporia cocos (strain MD-104) TaxID=742152 RepID=A0A2H3JB23_WOLCO|nr:transducin protein/WD-40 repeat protein [Wolfiporia cocos MD-104 SS10]